MLEPLERFVVLLYDRTNGLGSVNQARKYLFTQKSRTINNIPPTKASLMQHTKRAAYQAGHCWGQMMIAAPELPSPSDWGWKKNDNNGWEVFWTTLPEATHACRKFCAVAARKVASGIVSALRRRYRALPFATVVVNVRNLNSTLYVMIGEAYPQSAYM